MNIRYVFSLIIIFVGVSVKSATPAQPIQITWEESLRLVTENNNELKSAIETFKSTSELESGSRSGFLPVISGSVSTSQSMTGTLSTNAATSDSASLSLSQNLFSGFSDLSKYKQAQFNTVAAKSSLQIAEAKVRSDFMQALAGFIYAKDSMNLSQQIYDRRKENLNIVQLRFSSGRENKGSVLLSEAYYQQAQYDQILSKENFKIAESNLISMLGLQQEQTVEFKGVIPRTQPSKEDINYEKLAVQIPDLQFAIAQEESARQSVDISKSNFYPSLDFSASTGKVDQSWSLGYDKWSTGLTLTIPLFSGGKDYSAVHSSTAKWQSALQSRISTQSKLITKLKQSFSDYLLSVEKVKVATKFKSAAITRAEIARSKYNNGLMTFEEWDLVESDLILREQNALTSQRDSVNSEAAWSQALGIGVLQ